jgi:putative ATP-binding cassette transporter
MKSFNKLFALFSRYSRRNFILAVVTGVISGASSAAFLAIINVALHGGRPIDRPLLVVGFLAMLLLAPGSRLIAQHLLVSLGQEVIYDLRLRLSRRILVTPLAHLEKVGPHKLLVALTDDVGAITETLVGIPDVMINGSLVLGTLIYMGWLSPPLLIAFLVTFLPFIFFVRYPLRRGFASFRQARAQEDALYRDFHGVTEGTKELKLHRDRRTGFLDRLATTAENLRRFNIKAYLTFSGAISGIWTFFYLAIGLVIFVAPLLWPVSQEAKIGYALVLLFIRTPLQLIVSFFPTLGRAGAAVESIERLGLGLGEEGAEVDAPSGDSRSDWSLLELAGVTYVYHRADGEQDFTLGPIDLSFTPGELVFVIGGNGSGKSSLAKLLVGLYEPTSGEIRFAGEVVTRREIDRYRQSFAVVFSDFYLFDDLFGLGGPDQAELSRRYLKRLHLASKVEVRDGRLSTTALSQGQRKRLALLTAYLEDRPLYLFDEWAADQDPYFKEIFYRELLPQLRARGKTVIVISHDDRYYGLADRIIKLAEGRVVFDGPVGELAGEAASWDEAALLPSEALS